MFDIDITMRLPNRNGGKGFCLHSRLATSGSRLVLFGPSGSGKTLTLQAIAGLIHPQEGHIRVNGKTLYDSEQGVDLPARKRKVGIIFQDYALLPHMSVRQNIRFGAKRMWRRTTKEIAEKVERLIEACGLAGVADALPGEISGGQRQRTALARGLAADPELLLLDEPFSALDKPLRARMQEDLFNTLERFKLPLILVTHDAEEMERFAETVAVYDNGQVTAVEGAGGRPIDTVRIHEAVSRAYCS
jgi:molybdate transport system ATP-binding protein